MELKIEDIPGYKKIEEKNEPSQEKNGIDSIKKSGFENYIKGKSLREIRMALQGISAYKSLEENFNSGDLAVFHEELRKLKYDSQKGNRLTSEVIFAAQGYNGLPTVLIQKEYEKVIESIKNDPNNNNIAEIYRTTASDENSHNFKYGPLFEGKGIYGDGSYGAFAPNLNDEFYSTKDTLDHLERYDNEKQGKGILRMILKPGSKIIDATDALFAMEEDFKKGVFTKAEEAIIGQDIGVWAAMNGYDAIEAHSDNTGVYGYINILNRTALLVQDEEIRKMGFVKGYKTGMSWETDKGGQGK